MQALKTTIRVALCMSFKTFEMSDLKRALSEQESVDLHVTKSFSGSKEIDGAPSQLSGRTALEAAKRKRVHQQASLRSEIISGDGEGRATRECELIWGPIFDSSDNGFLTLRVYVGKVHLWHFLCYSYIAYDKMNVLKLTMLKRRQQKVF